MAAGSVLKKWIPRRLSRGGPEEVDVQDDDARVNDLQNEVVQEIEEDPIEPIPDREDPVAQAEAGRSPVLGNSAAPSPEALASHPVPSDRSTSDPPSPSDGERTLRSSPSSSLLPATPPRGTVTMASPSSAGSAPSGGRGTGEFQAHLRTVTANLVDILDQISTNGGSSTATPASSSKDGSPQRRHTHTIGSRGDSVATIIDLEAPSGVDPTAGDVEVVPAHHVRRLTTTLVDILRSMAGVAGQPTGAPNVAGQKEGPVPHETSALLGDTASELSLDSDKLSVGTSRTAAESARDSEISAQTALLKAQYLPQPEYRGDDVRPFYLDHRGRTSPFPLTAVSEDGASIAGDRSDAAPDMSAEVASDYPIPRKLVKKRRINWPGLFVFFTFFVALVTYVGIRAAKTLGLGGSLWYGAIVLSVEILGGLAMLPYGLCLCMYVPGEPPPQGAAADAAAKGQPPATAVGYHIRVVIPCYKEPLEVICKTFMAAMYAALPPNCRRTVYLLDDGRDADKRRFVRSLGLANAVYISGRKRAKGEMNGKSANINNAMRQIYPVSVPIPLDEVVCVFDADQVPNADFFTKTVPLLDGGQDVAMVLSPQTFYNLNSDGDIFNHANVHFWDYTQRGYDALGLISCTGTNFLLRARAFSEAGWFPEWTLTEDFALGIELKRRGWQCRYVDEYLAVGEAPEEVRNCFQQRSRWAKGHFQVFFSRGRNPAIGSGSKGLSWLMRWMYGSVVLSYFSAFLGTPLLMLVPIITVWFGAFPIVINFWAAVAITVYYGATLLLMYYSRSLSHLKSMWFASVSNSILWWAFLKAMYRATIGRWLSGTIVFKVTAKGLQRLNNLPFRDVWMATVWFVFSLVTLIFGLVHFFKGGVLNTPLAISLIFMVYNLIPQYLLLQYVTFRPRMVFNLICRIAMLLSTALAILGVVLVWLLYPKSYNYQTALGNSLFFMDTQRVGVLPSDFRVYWRHSAFLAESNCSVYLAANPNDTLTAIGAGAAFDPLAAGGFGTSPSATGGTSFGSPSAFSSSSNPFGRRRLLQATTDPFAAAAGATPTAPANPFGAASTPAAPAASTGANGAAITDPFAATATPAAPTAPAAPTTTTPSVSNIGSAANPFGPSTGTATDPFASSSPSVAGTAPSLGTSTPAGPNPFAPAGSLGSTGSGGFGASTDPFSQGAASNPFGASSNPFAPAGAFGAFGPASEQAPLATSNPWDVAGGWVTGMKAGNMKATAPMAFTTTVMAWGFMSFPKAFEAAGQTGFMLESLRVGADYLSKLYHSDPSKNTSLLISRVGDVDTEMLLWYRPEDGGPRPAYAVDLAAQGINGAAGGDIGGGVAAGLAAASIVFTNSGDANDTSYAAGLLSTAKEIYSVAKTATQPYTEADFNMTLLYNSTTVYDDLTWAAGWLFKATQDEAYLSDFYNFYVKHLEVEGPLSDWKYAFDWDNVFWPANVLMAQETGQGTYKQEARNFLRSWMCANHAANYTQRGRAFNPMSGTLGATANAALLALMYSDVIAEESPSEAQTYQCWALSQMRYVLGDSGQSLVVGMGSSPPTRTQDRDASCPPPPAVCNRVTGLLSPDKDTYVLKGTLVQGSGFSDAYTNSRTSDAARIGVENNAGFIGALAGAALLPDGMWEVCLQQYGIIRNSPVCGSFVSV